MHAAHQFAYDNRKIIHAAFDKGVVKAEILDRLAGMFSKSSDEEIP